MRFFGRSDGDDGEEHALPPIQWKEEPEISSNIFAGLLSGSKLTDATCGYRAYKLDILKRAEFDWHAEWLDTYGFEYYLYAKVLREKSIRKKEVPVTMRYPGKGKRYSKIKPFKGWYEMLKPWVVARVDGKGFSPKAA